MNNEEKLVRTLCGMLPYGLKGTTFYSETDTEPCSLSYSDRKNNQVGIESWLFGKYKILPHLHSLDRLLTGILDEENSYYFNLNCELCDILEVSNCEYFLKSLMRNEYYALSINKAFEAFEWLKSNHFNIYNLPSDMYIEKSTV